MAICRSSGGEYIQGCIWAPAAAAAAAAAAMVACCACGLGLLTLSAWCGPWDAMTNPGGITGDAQLSGASPPLLPPPPPPQRCTSWRKHEPNAGCGTASRSSSVCTVLSWGVRGSSESVRSTVKEMKAGVGGSTRRTRARRHKGTGRVHGVARQQMPARWGCRRKRPH